MIVTGWGGTLDFLPPDYPHLVAYDLVPTIDEPADAWWSPCDGERWARARIDDAARLLRTVYDDRDEARGWGRRLRDHVSATFAAGDVIAQLLDALRPA